VSVDRGVSRGTSQILVLPVRDMEMSLGVSVFLGETEINHIDLVAALSNAHEKVVGLDVSVDEISRVDVFRSRNELVGEKEDGFEREFSVAEVEEVFKGWATTRSAQPPLRGDR
jgi:hypothetical protein